MHAQSWHSPVFRHCNWRRKQSLKSRIIMPSSILCIYYSPPSLPPSFLPPFRPCFPSPHYTLPTLHLASSSSHFAFQVAAQKLFSRIVILHISLRLPTHQTGKQMTPMLDAPLLIHSTHLLIILHHTRHSSTPMAIYHKANFTVCIAFLIILFVPCVPHPHPQPTKEQRHLRRNYTKRINPLPPAIPSCFIACSSIPPPRCGEKEFQLS
ncbi:hypothetical protein TcWFU_008026 [Taenia crassiceps]|uniref:Uncharacterized protein n=1 Tax=Taenia crassiceps TaxID=6207 RepID=A0ABR4QJN6_9CEST